MPRPRQRAAPVLKTPRLRLLPLGIGRLDALHRHWTRPEVRRYLWDGREIPRQEAELHLRKSLEHFRRHGWGLWAVTEREGDGSLGGTVGLLPVPEQPGEVEILFSLEPAWQRRGLATEAASAVVAHGFATGLERIVGRCDAPNEASRRVLERLGMRFVRRAPIHGLDSLHYDLDRPPSRAGDA